MAGDAENLTTVAVVNNVVTIRVVQCMHVQYMNVDRHAARTTAGRTCTTAVRPLYDPCRAHTSRTITAHPFSYPCLAHTSRTTTARLLYVPCLAHTSRTLE